MASSPLLTNESGILNSRVFQHVAKLWSVTINGTIGNIISLITLPPPPVRPLVKRSARRISSYRVLSSLNTETCRRVPHANESSWHLTIRTLSNAPTASMTITRQGVARNPALSISEHKIAPVAPIENESVMLRPRCTARINPYRTTGGPSHLGNGPIHHPHRILTQPPQLPLIPITQSLRQLHPFPRLHIRPIRRCVPPARGLFHGFDGDVVDGPGLALLFEFKFHSRFAVAVAAVM